MCHIGLHPAECDWEGCTGGGCWRTTPTGPGLSLATTGFQGILSGSLGIKPAFQSGRSHQLLISRWQLHLISNQHSLAQTPAVCCVHQEHMLQLSTAAINVAECLDRYHSLSLINRTLTVRLKVSPLQSINFYPCSSKSPPGGISKSQVNPPEQLGATVGRENSAAGRNRDSRGRCRRSSINSQYFTNANMDIDK